MHLDAMRGLAWLALSLSLFSVAFGPVVARAAEASGGEPEQKMSKEEFDRVRKEILRRSAVRQAEMIASRLSIVDRDREYVDREVRKRMDQGRSQSQALEEVVGSAREDRIEKAYRRLLEVHIPREEDRNRIRSSFEGARPAILGAGFSPDGVQMAIPFIESGYDPKAFNVERLNGETVKGMWQFTESTGRDHGLTVTTQSQSEAAEDPDERYNPNRSSQAAKSYLDQLQSFRFANGCPATSELVLASYHMGQGNVNKKIRKYGCDFWNWTKDGEDGFGTHSYSYPALVLAGGKLLREMDLTP